MRGEKMIIKGEFQVELNPMDSYANGTGAVKLGRMSIDKTFHGDLSGSSKGEMLSAMTSTKGSALDPKRVFKLKVKEFESAKKLAWGDAMGLRVYSLSESGGMTTFGMTEKIGGPIFPLFAKMIPPFDQSFEDFARDLKKSAEKS